MMKIRTDILRAAAQAASKDPVRYYLQTVQIEPAAEGGVFAIATNGHLLFCGHDPDGHAEAPFLLDLTKINVLSKPFKSMRKDNGPRSLEWQHGSDIGEVDLDPLGTPIRIAECDGTFPEWRRVMPHLSGDSSPYVSFAPSVMSALLKSANEIGAETLSFAQSAPSSPALVTPDSNLGFWVVMPMRGETREKPPFSIVSKGDAA